MCSEMLIAVSMIGNLLISSDRRTVLIHACMHPRRVIFNYSSSLIMQASGDVEVQEVNRSALLKHAERVSAELACVHAQLRERELAVEESQQRATAAMRAAQEADVAACTHRCALVLLAICL